MRILKLLVLTTALSTGLMMAQTSTSSSGSSTAKTAKPTASKPAPTPPPSASDIAAAKAKNMVWVNLNTKVYHSSKDKEYGTTKNGKFMTEADAKAGGYKAAKS